MKHIFFKLVFSLYFCIPGNLYAYEYLTSVYDFDKNGHFILKEVILKDLLSRNTFDGKYFKIVHGKSDDAIKFNNNEHALKASHLYYHLQKARLFFLKKKSINHHLISNKIVIRIDITNTFDSYAHFAHDNYKQTYNTAITIPKSNHLRLPLVPPWSSEIWFRPAKVILTAGATQQLAALFEDKDTSNSFGMILVEGAFNRLFENGLSRETFQSFSQDRSILWLGASLVLLKTLPTVIRFAGRGYKRKYYLDTAMIPEIIYHEYTHYILSDYMPLNSTPVIEGYANYFAGRISDRAIWGKRPGQYSQDRGRNPYERDLYQFHFESKIFATSSFVYKLLWGLSPILSEDGSDQLIYHSRQYINNQSNIKNGLVDAIFTSLPILKMDDNNHKLQLHKFMQQLGL